MLVVCWSPKGGSGTSVVAAGLALTDGRSLLVDADGDQPAILGRDRSGAGLSEWLSARAADDALARLEEPINDEAALVRWGDDATPGSGTDDDAARTAGLLQSDPRLVVVDAGRAGTPLTAGLRDRADVSVCVLRHCYLAVTRAAAAPRADAVALVDEPGRALTTADVVAALDVPVEITVPWDPAIARAVDAGILADRQPRVLSRPLQRWGRRLGV